MDINSLLSPSETTRSVSSTPGSPQHPPFKFVQRTQSGPGVLKHGVGALSPLSQSVMNQSSIPAHVLSPVPQQGSSPLISPVPATNASHVSRPASTQSLETSPDLTLLQNHNLKSAPPHFRHLEGLASPKSPTLFNPAIVASVTSNPRASFDINMMEAPKQPVRIDFADTSLPVDRQQRLSELKTYVQDNPSAYQSHHEIVSILHQGFIDHTYPPKDSATRRDPRTYDLLDDLRNARETMERSFAVGEKLWIDWLQDESILARTAEERIAVVENFRKAVEEEVGSVPLWTAYGDWVQHCHHWSHENGRDNESDEERMVAKEIFTRQLMLDTWQEAVDHTSLNLPQSHLTWNKFLAIQIPNIDQKLESDLLENGMALFRDRLRTPHATWDDTFQLFSSFVSVNLEDRYEEIMSGMSRLAAEAKKDWSIREPYENAIDQAEKVQDENATYQAFTNYLEWEQTPEKRRNQKPELINALFHRAELRFPSYAALWEEHVAYLLSRSEPIILPLLEQATKHCPWSGSLWSQYLLSSDRADQSFHETEAIKHKATSTGLLEAAGIEEVVKVHGAWCSYLRRRSFRPDASEEDLDVAEMGIRSSIENVASLAAKLGLGEISDPAFRLHRIYIVFLSETGRWDNARQEFDNSVGDYGKSWEFWMMFYHWEMDRWRMFSSSQQDTSDEALGNVAPPHLATAVLMKALDQPDLDYPESIMQALITHCEDFEDAEGLQSAMMKVRKVGKTMATKHRDEAASAAEGADKFAGEQDHPSLSNISKRKRDEDTDTSNKKLKSEEAVKLSLEEVQSVELKRDREHATILVENLPDDVTDIRIRQYFSNCGVVRAVKLLHEDGVSAIVEFEDDEAAKYALSRNEQELDGSIISITLDTGSTLYLTNYKPSADEAYVHSLMKQYGELVGIRFPSLQGNKRRRFCYVQFKLPTEAQSASNDLDGREIDGYTLICKISNPAHRQARNEVDVNDGCTVFVGQLNFKAKEPELDQVFSRCGSIQKIRMPLHPIHKTRNKGIAYVTYSAVEEAEKAVSLMNRYNFMGRNLKVEIATNKPSASQKQASSTRSVTPTPNSEASKPYDESRRERQVFLSNVPDTVNEARFRDIGNQYGTVTRVVLKTNHQGAILEYSQAAEAGQASLKLDGYEIAPGRHVRIVSEAEMLTGTREKKLDGFLSRSERLVPKPIPLMTNVRPIRRPQQPGNKRGGNLGQRSVLAHSVASDKTNGEGKEGKKSNNDFRAMLNK